MRPHSLAVLVILFFVSQMASALSLESSGIDGDFVFGSSPDLLPRASGRYEFSSFELRAGDSLDVTPFHAGDYLYLLASGEIIIDGDLISEGKMLVVGSGGALTINGRIKAPFIWLFANEIINHGAVEPRLGLVWGAPPPGDWDNSELITSPILIRTDMPSIGDLVDSGSVIFVPRNPVPLPATLPLLTSAMVLVGALAHQPRTLG